MGIYLTFLLYREYLEDEKYLTCVVGTGSCNLRGGSKLTKEYVRSIILKIELLKISD